MHIMYNLYNACKTHLHTKQWEKLFYLWCTSWKNITLEPYTRLLLKWYQNVRKPWKKKSHQVSAKFLFKLQSYREKSLFRVNRTQSRFLATWLSKKSNFHQQFSLILGFISQPTKYYPCYFMNNLWQLNCSIFS